MTQYRPLLVALFFLAVAVAPAAYAQEGLAEARASFLEGRYDDAIGQFTRLAQQDPGSAEVTRGWIRALVDGLNKVAPDHSVCRRAGQEGRTITLVIFAHG